jgi:hypothetical protein
LVIARGGVGIARDLRGKIGTNEGGLSQSPPFFFGLWRLAAILLLAQRVQAA